MTRPRVRVTSHSKPLLTADWASPGIVDGSWLAFEVLIRPHRDATRGRFRHLGRSARSLSRQTSIASTHSGSPPPPVSATSGSTRPLRRSRWTVEWARPTRRTRSPTGQGRLSAALTRRGRSFRRIEPGPPHEQPPARAAARRCWRSRRRARRRRPSLRAVAGVLGVHRHASLRWVPDVARMAADESTDECFRLTGRCPCRRQGPSTARTAIGTERPDQTPLRSE
jgi:hypothetical protein